MRLTRRVVCCGLLAVCGWVSRPRLTPTAATLAQDSWGDLWSVR